VRASQPNERISREVATRIDSSSSMMATTMFLSMGDSERTWMHVSERAVPPTLCIRIEPIVLQRVRQLRRIGDP